MDRPADGAPAPSPVPDPGKAPQDTPTVPTLHFAVTKKVDKADAPIPSPSPGALPGPATLVAAPAPAPAPEAVVVVAVASTLPPSASATAQDKLLLAAPRLEHEGQSVPSLGGIPLLRKLGQGGMGAVYYGVHPRLGTEVAVKVLPFDLAEREPQLVRRFQLEARLAARVRSAHLVAVTDVNEEGGLFYLVMEFVRGTTAGGWLRERVEAGQGPLDEATAIEICIAATKGLAAAHAEGIIHRDVKPENVMLPFGPDGAPHFAQAKLCDLGLARSDELGQSLTGAQAAMGTPGYMAPEQAMDARSAGKPADVFSMGATLHALLSGRAPFHGSTAMQTILATLHQPPQPLREVRPDVSDLTVALLDRCLSKEPKQRFVDAHALLAALKVAANALRAHPDTHVQAVQEIHALVEAQEVGKGQVDVTTLDAELGRGPLPMSSGTSPAPASASGRVAPAAGAAVATPLPAVSAAPGPGPLAAPTPMPGAVYAPAARRVPVALLPAAVALLAAGGVYLAMRPSSTHEAKPPTHPAPVAPGLPTAGQGPEAAKELALDLGSGVSIPLAWVPAGKLAMGSPVDELGRSLDEEPLREVTISHAFYMGRYEVTQTQWSRVMGSNPSRFKDPMSPVENVSWDEAKGFCLKLGRTTGREVRLPTEAQFEYACRAGTTTPFSTGATLSSREANVHGQYVYGAAPRGEFRNRTVPVGTFAPNVWGLYDLHGNVWEWCEDGYAETAYADLGPSEDAAPTVGDNRVLRGGAWNYGALFARSAARFWLPSYARGPDVGFRVVVPVK
ncbi:MAG: SUMF1/EgtB/PvdO family nonheme iron enzyme [Planctomycetes bacterium]|nr:SUMF1/EgtB/PvdO family nonheme iron enzyme [Planctomycetota bacterium]